MAESWNTAALELPQEFRAALDAFSGVLDSVSAAARVAKAAVDLARALGGALRDPVALLAQALQDEVEGLLADLRKAGAYLSGDWLLAQYPYQGLLGGYPAYERRMVARLSDRTDPTRPDLSSQSAVAAAFFYAAGTPASIEKPLALLGWLTGLVGVGSRGGGQYPAPTQVRAAAADPAGLSAPDALRVSWHLPPGAGLPPGGFVVAVSTIPGPLRLAASRPDKLPPGSSGKVPSRHAVPLADEAGRPIDLYGGGDQLEGVSQLGQVPEISAVAEDGTPVALKDLGSGGDSRVMRLFRLTSRETLARWPTGQFFLNIRRADLPKTSAGTSSLASAAPLTYFIRVAAVPADVADGKKEWKYDVGAAAKQVAAGQPARVALAKGLAPGTLGAWSQPPAAAALPGAGTSLAAATQVVASALAVLALCRPDLPVLTSAANLGKAFAAAPCGLEPYANLLALLYPRGYAQAVEKAGRDPLAFRVDLHNRCLVLARQVLEQSGPGSQALSRLVSAGQPLQGTRVGDLLSAAGEQQSLRAAKSAGVADASVLDLLRTEDSKTSDRLRTWLLAGASGPLPEIPMQPGSSRDVFLAPNPLSAGLPPDAAAALLRVPGAVRQRAPQLLESRSPQSDFPFRGSVSAADAPLAIEAAPGGIREVYLRFQQVDGSIQVPKLVADYVADLLQREQAAGSADLLPVLVLGPAALAAAAGKGRLDPAASDGAGMLVFRSLLARYNSGQLLSAAAAVLGQAGGAVARTPADGSWVAFRPLDMLPGIDVALDAASAVLGRISASAGNAAEAAAGYADFLGAQVDALGSMAQKLQVLIAGAADVLSRLPEASVLAVVGKGTDDVLSQLVTSQNKPQDGKDAYAAGAVLLAGGAPSFLIDLLGGGGAAGESPVAAAVPDGEPQVP